MVLFQYGVAVHELESERIRAGGSRWPTSGRCSGDLGQDAPPTRQGLRRLPLLAGPMAPFVFTGNLSANLIRNIWSFAIIFCGHFPDGTSEFTVEETHNESRGQWYFRQILGSANLTGGRMFHVLSGNLSFQIEHHLFPDLPARRLRRDRPQVREICAGTGSPTTAGPAAQQFATVVRKVIRLALPPRRTAERPAEAARAA